MADELEVKKDNPNPRSRKNSKSEEQKLPYRTVAEIQKLSFQTKLSSKVFIYTDNSWFKLLIFFVIFYNFLFPLTCWFAVINIILSTIDLLKQKLFPIARKDSRIESFWAKNVTSTETL